MKSKILGYFSAIIAQIYLFLATPEVLEACSSCDTMSKYSQAKLDSYFYTIILLAGTPLLFGGILVFIVYKSAKKAKSSQE